MPKVFSLATARRMATDSTAINALDLPVPGYQDWRAQALNLIFVLQNQKSLFRGIIQKYSEETRDVRNTKEERTWSKVLNIKSFWRGKNDDKCSTSKTTPNKKWYKNAKIWKFETDQLEAKNTWHSRERHFKIKHVNVNTVFSKCRAKLKPLVTKTIPVMVNTTYVEALYLKSYFFSNLCYLLLYYPFILLKTPPKEGMQIWQRLTLHLPELTFSGKSDMNGYL